MSRRTKEEAEQTRSRIMANALSLFVKRGYERTTFNDIAARLKLTKGAVYWHFESKEALLVAVVQEMLRKFNLQLDATVPKTGYTFMAIAEMMVENALRIAGDRRESEYFMLLHAQIKWSADSMEKTRQELLSGRPAGPYHAFIRAIENDRDNGLVGGDVDPVSVASAAMAVWEGLVRSKIEKFLECDLEDTLRGTYRAMWDSIRSDRAPAYAV